MHATINVRTTVFMGNQPEYLEKKDVSLKRKVKEKKRKEKAFRREQGEVPKLYSVPSPSLGCD